MQKNKIFLCSTLFFTASLFSADEPNHPIQNELHEAIKAKRSKTTLESLLKKHDPQETDLDGNTALHLLALNPQIGQLTKAQLLVSSVPNRQSFLKMKNKKGKTAIALSPLFALTFTPQSRQPQVFPSGNFDQRHDVPQKMKRSSTIDDLTKLENSKTQVVHSQIPGFSWGRHHPPKKKHRPLSLLNHSDFN